ncbi:hypothetical protein OV142_41735 [Nannocystis sp. SCPEA4]|nr:hypothetical protein [Nannocystis sp. SCPEA4]
MDDPWFYRWWRRSPRSAYRRPLRISAAMILVALVALVVVILLRSP